MSPQSTRVTACPVCAGSKECEGEKCWACDGTGEDPTPTTEATGGCTLCTDAVADADLLAHLQAKHPDQFQPAANLPPKVSEGGGSGAPEPTSSLTTKGLPASGETTAREPERTPPPSEAPRRRARVAEGKPWEPDNSDGSLNLGSYAFMASAAMAEWAFELLVARDRETAELGKTEPPRSGQVKNLAGHLLDIADRVQANLRADGRVDRMDASHTRARGAVRTVLPVHPVPFGAELNDILEWTDAVTAAATGVLEAAVALVEPRQ